MTDEAMNEQSSSRFKDIINGFQEKLKKIDALDEHVDKRIDRLRRRMGSVMEQTSALRNSHLRLFCSHQCKPMPITMDSLNVPRPPTFEWTLQIEGALLIGALDHTSAKEFDRRVGHRPLPNDSNTSKMDIADESINHVQFTHLFSKITCQMSTLYMPKPNPMAAKKKPLTKKSRRTSKGSAGKGNDAHSDPKTLQQSAKTNFSWNSTMSHDTEAMHILYQSPNPPAHSHQIHSAVATIQLHPKRSADKVFQVNSEMEALFPGYGPSSNGLTAGMKRPADEMSDSIDPIPTNNEIEIPNVLTMQDIVEAFYIYVQDRKLNDENEPSLVNCDATLQNILQVASFQFSDLQKILTEGQLIRQVNEEPIHITYILKPETAIVVPPPPAQLGALPTSEDEVQDRMPLSVLQLDMDVAVPNLMLPRCRNLMRRMKRRSLEAASIRARVRTLFMSRVAVSDTEAKRALQLAGDRISADHAELYQACAQAAPEGSLTRKLFHLDAEMSILMGKVEERLGCLSRPSVSAVKSVSLG